jgi:hypothetical protein
MQGMKRFPLLVALCLWTLTISLACGGGGNGNAVATRANDAFRTSVPPSDPIPPGQLGKINVILAGTDYYVGRNNFVFGITNLKDEPQGGAKATATFYDLSDRANPRPVGTFPAVEGAPGVGAVTQVVHANGEVHTHGGQDDNRVGYYVDYTFAHDGFWGVVVQATLKDGTQGASDIGFQVNKKGLFPQPGQKATPSDNLTKADVQNISEIDSGSPPNDMHDVKIKDAIAKGRPVVIVFSTPAYCTSRFCGPVNEEVENLQRIYKDTVDFVHIEIWRNFEKREFNPTVREWLLQKDGSLTEPWVFIVGKDGVIYDRFEGPASRNVMEPSVKAVAEGKTFATR